MSAAHELVERGFEVVVLERAYMAGGKARSIGVLTPPTGEFTGHEHVGPTSSPIDHRVPGEHGFRFFPGFYKHIVDTMQRTPLPSGGSTADHLVPTTRVAFTQYGKAALILPAAFPTTPRDASTVLRAILLAFGPVTDLTPDDLAFFGGRIWQIMTSCEERRLAEYEKANWWDFVDAGRRSEAYRKFLAVGFTRSMVASKAREANSRTVGDMFIQLMLTVVNPTAGPADRVLDGPTNRVWVNPWRAYLESKGVRYYTDAEVQSIRCEGKRISGVDVIIKGKRTLVHGDHYIAALPIERIAPMVNPAMLEADPSLANLRTLAKDVEWMTGVQFYLRRSIPMVQGHASHVDSEWALTSISQLHFWRNVDREDLGDSDVKAILSVDVSDWGTPGPNGRPARNCHRDEAIREVWRQLKRSINIGSEILRDDDVEAWFLDPDIVSDPANPRVLMNTEPLLVNLYDKWRLRPDAITKIDNLFLASDYVRTYTDLATMEGANEAARRAVNGLLDAVKSERHRCTLWRLQEPDVLSPFRLYDKARFDAGQPWDASMLHVAANALRGASPVLDQAASMLAAIAPFTLPIDWALNKTQDTLDAVGLGPGFQALQTHARPAVFAPLDAAVQAAEMRSQPAPGPAGLAPLDAPVRMAEARSQPIPVPAMFAPPNAAPTTDTRSQPRAVAAATDTGPTVFDDRLAWYRDGLAPTLSAAIPGWEPQRYLYGPVKDFIGRAGKGLRPALCIATARALGGRGEDAYPAAAGIEMLHNAFLVHDDIEDGSESRRGAPTMHRAVGTPLAINIGDAMNALAARLVRQSSNHLGPATVLRILDEVDHMLVATLEGQAMELGWVRDNNIAVTVDDYLRMVLKKTAWYSFIHPLRIGALVANGRDDNLARFDRFGYLIGLAFQIRDDVLNLTGTQHYGKEINGDLWEGKRTLALINALASATPTDRAWMKQFLAKPRAGRLSRDVLKLRDMIGTGGGLAWAESAASALAHAATNEFESAFAGVPPGPDLNWLRSAIDYLVKRDV
jgi:geranylgeranyl pyrophosphate synthase/uncharacterized protein with NAD-binding domain and iron-sulfur cluster